MTTMAAANTAMKQRVAHLEKRFGRKRVYLVGGGIVLVFLFIFLRTLTTRHKETPPPPPRPVLVAKVTTEDVPIYLDEIGTCAAYETVLVQAQVTGKIMERHFQDGADVKKGDLLFTIDPAPYKAAVDQAKAQAALDDVTLKRQADLRTKGVNAPQDYDQAVANAQKSQAAAEAAQVNLDYCYIKGIWLICADKNKFLFGIIPDICKS